jgi:hypothetical protein
VRARLVVDRLVGAGEMSVRIKAVVDRFVKELQEALDADIQDRIMKEREMQSYIEVKIPPQHFCRPSCGRNPRYSCLGALDALMDWLLMSSTAISISHNQYSNCSIVTYLQK